MTGPAGKRPSRDPHQLSRPDLAAQMVADILKQKIADVKETKAAVRAALPRRRNWKGWLLALIPAFCVLTAWNVLNAGVEPQVFTPDELAASLRFKIYIAVQGIRAFRDSAGTLPQSLQQIRMADEGLAYVRSDTTYVIVGSAGAVHLTYRSIDDLTPYRGAAHALERKRS
jgi:hypothetical protein